MFAVVDSTLCIGCRLCVGTCPEVFSMDGAVSIALRGELPTEYNPKVLEAAESCPVAAIHLEGAMEE